MIRPLPQGRTYTIAIYIGSLVFVLAGLTLAAGGVYDVMGEAIGTMPAFAAALGVVAGAYGAKATAQHYRGVPKPDPEPMVREELP